MNKRDIEFSSWIEWMIQNWETNGWDLPEHHYAQLFPVIKRMMSGTYSNNDLKTMIAWTHPRSEIFVGMTPPDGVDNTGGWGAAKRVSEIHEYLKTLKSKIKETE